MERKRKENRWEGKRTGVEEEEKVTIRKVYKLKKMKAKMEKKIAHDETENERKIRGDQRKGGN